MNEWMNEYKTNKQTKFLVAAWWNKQGMTGHAGHQFIASILALYEQ